jgi:putative N6-adenine-specific DNA methylase
METNEKYLAKTLKGLENVLADELKELGAADVQVLNRGVSFRGGHSLLYKVNVASRLALRVLVPVYAFEATDENTLYRKIKGFDWGRYLDSRMTFSIDPVVHSPHFRNSHFVAQKVKDAIADRFRDRTGLRPSVHRERPDLLINVHIAADHVTVSLDSSGGSLHKRGYRIGQPGAPLNEVLAAGMIRLAGWRGDTPFLDPMCGSGTLAIEAALVAAGIPPGFFRKDFGFEKWKSFDPELLESVVRSLPAEKEVRVPILARDIDREAVALTRKELARMDLARVVETRVMDFAESEQMEGVTIIMNPPYGERMKPAGLDSLYSMIGNTLKHRFPGSDAWVLSSSTGALKKVGLKPGSKQILYNGALECTYVNYKTFEGSWKDYRTVGNC